MYTSGVIFMANVGKTKNTNLDINTLIGKETKCKKYTAQINFPLLNMMY